jgi:hypothetical protein
MAFQLVATLVERLDSLKVELMEISLVVAMVQLTVEQMVVESAT